VPFLQNSSQCIPLAPTQVKANQMGGTCDFMLSCVSVWGCRAEEMAQVKVPGDTVRTHQDYTDVYSDMATVTSSAGESKTTNIIILQNFKYKMSGFLALYLHLS